MDQGELAFVVIDPLVISEEYPIEAVKNLLNQLEVCKDDEVLVMAICTVPAPPEITTVNLLAPIGIGLETRNGAQVILHNSEYSAQTEFSLVEKAA